MSPLAEREDDQGASKTTHRPPIPAGRLALVIASLNGVLVLAGTGATLVFAGHFTSDLGMVAALVYSVLAVLVISRHPRHTIGWIFLTVGCFSALRELVPGLQAMQPTPSLESVYTPTFFLIFFLGGLTWIPAFIIPISLVLLYFPDGRLPSRRWWPISAAAVLGMCGIASTIFRPWPFPAAGIYDTYNPYGIPGSEPFFDVALSLSTVCLAIGIFGSLAALVVRFVRSAGTERIQMKWLVYTAAVGVAVLLAFNNPSGNPVGDSLFVSLPTLLAIVIAIAILRYRLFDIDLIIRRTLIYSLLTGLLALTYFGCVVVLQAVLRALTSQAQNQLVTVVSTLTIAALFVPLRSRVQRFIDRRFYRRKYDAARALTAFGTQVRDVANADLSGLSEHLLAVVQDTMQPSHVSLWLRTPPNATADQRQVWP